LEAASLAANSKAKLFALDLLCKNKRYSEGVKKFLSLS